MSLRILSLVLLSSVTLMGCEQGRRVMGLAREQPDEFTLETRKPLQMPSSFSDLPEPTPGARAAHDADPRQEAQSVLGFSNQSAAAPSVGERKLIEAAGGHQVEAQIRQKVNQEADLERQDHHATQTVFFWQKNKEHGKAIDPKAEYERLHGDKHPTETMPLQPNVQPELTSKGE
ncbi:MAG: DUF3035 domain-containing protein [Holosporales bacterium]